MGLEDQVRTAIRAETERIPAWAPEMATIRRSARSQARRQATVTGFVAALAALAVTTTGLLGALPRVDTAPPVDEPEQKPRALALLGEDEAVPAGRYNVPVLGQHPEEVWAEIDVVSGFRTVLSTLDRQTYVTAPVDRNTPPRPAGLAVWAVTGVNADPCHGDPLPAFQRYRDPGPTVSDLAGALSRQPYRVGGPPQPVTLAGYDGLYLELRFPDGFEPGACATGRYEAWASVDPHSRGRAERFWYDAGSVDRLWILDVEGTTLVVNSFHDTRTPEDQLAALDTMVDSLAIRTADEG